MLTPPFQLVGGFFAHLPQWGPLPPCPGGAIFISPGEGHFHFPVAPVGISSDSNRFLFLTNFLLWVPLLGLVITPSPDRLLMGLVITSPPDCILGQRPAFDIWLDWIVLVVHF